MSRDKAMCPTCRGVGVVNTASPSAIRTTVTLAASTASDTELGRATASGVVDGAPESSRRASGLGATPADSQPSPSGSPSSEPHSLTNTEGPGV